MENNIEIPWASQVVSVVKNLPANSEDVRDAGLIPGSGKSPGGGHGNPLQCSGTWWTTVQRFTKSQTQRVSTEACTQKFLKKIKTELPHGPSVPLLGIYLEKVVIGKVTCTPVFISVLFTISMTWRQPICPSTEEQRRNVWHIYTMENYSVINKLNNAICSNKDGPRYYHINWSKSEKYKCYMTPPTCAI